MLKTKFRNEDALLLNVFLFEGFGKKAAMILCKQFHCWMQLPFLSGSTIFWVIIIIKDFILDSFTHTLGH